MEIVQDSLLTEVEGTPLSELKDKYEDRSLAEDIFYNFNTTVASWKNTKGSDESLKDVFGPTRDFNIGGEQEKKYMSSLAPQVLETIDWSKVDSWEKLYTIENRIAESTRGMAHIQDKLGTAGTFAVAFPAAVVDPYDALALAPIGWVYKSIKATTTAGKVFKGITGGGAYGYASESLYQSNMEITDPNAKVLATVFGSTLLGTSSVFTKSARNTHNVVTDIDETGVEKERVLTDNEVAQINVDKKQKVVNTLVENNKDTAEKIVEYGNEVKNNKQFSKQAEKELKQVNKEYEQGTKRYDELKQTISRQEELAQYDELKANSKTVDEELINFNTSRKTIQKQLAEDIKEKNRLVKIQAKAKALSDNIVALKKELSDRTLNGKPTKALLNKLNKMRAEYSKFQSEVKIGTKATNRKIRDLTKAIKDNQDVLKNSAAAKVDLDNRSAYNKRQLDSFLKNTTLSNLNKLKRYSLEDLNKELNSIDLSAISNRANRALAKAKMFSRKLEESSINLQNTKENKQNIKQQIVTERSMLDTLQKELEDLTRIKNDMETLANEGEGKLEKVGGFMPYITPKSLLQSSSNSIVRGAALRLYAPAVALKDAAGQLIPTGMDAKSFKNRYEANWTVALHELYNGYKKAVQEGYKGSEAEYFDEMTKKYIKANDVAKQKAEDLGKDAVVAPKYEDSNTHIQKGMSTLGKYFKEMGDIGKGLEVEGFKTISPGAYIPRIFDSSKITKMGKPKAINYLAEAMLKKNPNKDPIKARETATRIVSSIENNNYMSQLVRDGYGKSSDSARQIIKKLDVYDSDIQDIIGTNALELGSAYSYSMSGRFSLQKMFGFTKAEDINDFLNTLTKQGMTPKERDSMETLFNTLLGTRELMTNPNSFYGKTLRMLTKGNFTIYSMGFGITSMVEVANIMGTTGVRPILDAHFDAVSNIRNDLVGNPANKKWINEFRAIGLVGDAINSRAIQRYDSVDTINSNGIIENSLDSWNNTLSKWSGLIPLTDALKTLSVGSGYSWLITTAKQGKLSAADKQRIYRMGLDENDLAMLKQIDSSKVKYDAQGTLDSFNFEEWDLDFGQKVQDALMRHVESTVLQPDGASLPMWMSDPNSPIARIMFQFMRFPISAYEQLSLRGMTEFDMKQTIGIGANIGLFTLLAQLKDIGSDRPRYDLNTDEGLQNMVMYWMTNNYGTGPVLTMMERAYTLGTGHQPFSTYNQGSSALLGISGTSLKNAQEAASGLIEADTQKAIKNMVELSPINSIPFIKHNIEPLLESVYE